MTRLTWVANALLATAVSLTGTRLAYANESQADIASKLNDEGKEQMYSNNYAGATASFRQAVAHVPEPKYFFNLCTSLYQEGKFDEALTACNAVANNNPAAELTDKTNKLVGRIKDEAKAQGIELHPAGGGGLPDPNAPPPDPNAPPPDPNAPPDPNVGRPLPPPAVGRAPQGQAVFAAIRPDHHYTWALGIDVYGGGGQIGHAPAGFTGDPYGHAMGGFRIKGDYMILPAIRTGVQAYLQVSQFTAGTDQMATGALNLDVLDVGLAAYRHICLRGFERLCLTPLVGVHLSLMDPNQDQGSGNQTFDYAAIGLRGELAATFAFGRRYEHVLSVSGGINAYSPVFSSPNDGLSPSAEQIGLDAFSVAGYVGVGYTYRFNTPFGSAAFVTLE